MSPYIIVIVRVFNNIVECENKIIEILTYSMYKRDFS